MRVRVWIGAGYSSDDADREISARITKHFESCAEGLVMIRGTVRAVWCLVGAVV